MAEKVSLEVKQINWKEIWSVLWKMENENTLGPDDIPFKAGKC